jgi:hypothetical protein
VEALQDDLLGGLGVDPAEGLLVELLGLDEIADSAPAWTAWASAT